MPELTTKRDPTRTQTIRRNYITDLNKRFRALKGAIRRLTIEQDAFGVGTRVAPFAVNTVWQFETNPEKVKLYRKWLKEQIEEGTLELGEEDLESINEPWHATYIDSSYRKGQTRAFVDSQKAKGLLEDQTFFQGRKEQFLNQAFAAPETNQKLLGLFQRNFSQLQGVTQAMDTAMSVTLTDGLANGLNPRQIATELNKHVDIGLTRAKRIARTEIIHAHSEGQLDAFERLGVTELGVMAEWITAGDNRVCPRCAALQGQVFTIKRARGILPRHPNCRCTWVPNVDATLQRDATKAPRRTEQAIRDSIRAEFPNARTLKEARSRSRWKGSLLPSRLGGGKVPKKKKNRAKKPFDGVKKPRKARTRQSTA